MRAACCSILDCGFIPLTNVKIFDLESEVDIVALGRILYAEGSPLNALVEVSWPRRGENIEEAREKILREKSNILDFLLTQAGFGYRGVVFVTRLRESDKVAVCKSESRAPCLIADAALLMKPMYTQAAMFLLCE